MISPLNNTLLFHCPLFSVNSTDCCAPAVSTQHNNQERNMWDLDFNFSFLLNVQIQVTNLTLIINLRYLTPQGLLFLLLKIAF